MGGPNRSAPRKRAARFPFQSIMALPAAGGEGAECSTNRHNGKQKMAHGERDIPLKGNSHSVACPIENLDWPGKARLARRAWSVVADVPSAAHIAIPLTASILDTIPIFCLEQTTSPAEAVMPSEMSKFREIVEAHMLRDEQENGKWTCDCEACVHMRSLTGIRKALDVRPLVREIRQTEERFEQLPDGPERKRLEEHFFNLHDRLASVIAK